MRRLSLSRRLRRRLRDAGGNAPVEFVLVFPILLLWLSYSLLFFDAFRSNSLTQKVAFTMSDIMSRHDAVDAVDIDYLVGLQDKMLPPRVDRRRTRITSICFEDGRYKVLWSHAHKDDDVEGKFDPLRDDTIPLDIMPSMANQDSVILTEVHARWTPLSSWGGLEPRDWTNALVTRPRYVQIIPHESLNDATVCPRDIG